MLQWFINKFGHGNPWSAFLHVLFLSHFIVAVVTGFISVYLGSVIGAYLIRNQHGLWKKCSVFSPFGARKLVNNTNDPVLRNLVLKQERYMKICLYTFLSVGVLMFIIFIIFEISEFMKM